MVGYSPPQTSDLEIYPLPLPDITQILQFFPKKSMRSKKVSRGASPPPPEIRHCKLLHGGVLSTDARDVTNFTSLNVYQTIYQSIIVDWKGQKLKFSSQKIISHEIWRHDFSLSKQFLLFRLANAIHTQSFIDLHCRNYLTKWKITKEIISWLSILPPKASTMFESK